MTFGRIVRVRTELLDGTGFLARIWFVAVDDDDGAMVAVRNAGGASADDLLDVLGQLPPDDVETIGLNEGGAKAYP